VNVGVCVCVCVCGLWLPLAAIHAGVLVAVVKADRGDIRFMAHNSFHFFFLQNHQQHPGSRTVQRARLAHGSAARPFQEILALS
jgi:hypothetical protein